MSKRVFDVSPFAERELENAVVFYRQKSSALSMNFLVCIKEAWRQIEEFPESGSVFDTRLRKVRVKKFPYIVIYHLTETRIQVLAIMHTRQAPQSFKERLPSSE